MHDGRDCGKRPEAEEDEKHRVVLSEKGFSEIEPPGKEAKVGSGEESGRFSLESAEHETEFLGEERFLGPNNEMILNGNDGGKERRGPPDTGNGGRPKPL